MAAPELVKGEVEGQGMGVAPSPQGATPTQAGGHRFSIWSWGSCRRGYVEILAPKYFNVDRMIALTGRHGEYTVDLGFAILRVKNMDSSKNYNREIWITPREPVLVRHYGSGSCNPKSRFDEVYLLTPDGREQKLEPATETKTVEEGKFRRTLLVKYVEYNGQKIELTRELLDEEVIPQKLVVKARIVNGRLVLNGDTYHVRDILKSLRFRWDDTSKVWWRDGEDYADLLQALHNRGVKLEFAEG